MLHVERLRDSLMKFGSDGRVVPQELHDDIALQSSSVHPAFHKNWLTFTNGSTSIGEFISALRELDASREDGGERHGERQGDTSVDGETTDAASQQNSDEVHNG